MKQHCRFVPLSQSLVGWDSGTAETLYGLDAIDAAAAFDLLGDDGEAKLLLQRARNRPSHRVGLPTEGLRNLIDAGTFGAAEHGDQLLLLGAGAQRPLTAAFGGLCGPHVALLG